MSTTDRIVEQMFRREEGAFFGTSSNQVGAEQEPLTLEKVLQAIKAIPPAPPDPLSGANHLKCPPDMMEQGRALAEAVAQGGFLGRIVTVEESRLLPAGFIVGFKGHEVALIVGPDQDVEPVEPASLAGAWNMITRGCVT